MISSTASSAVHHPVAAQTASKSAGDPSPEFTEFTRRLSASQVAVVEKKWQSLSNIEALADQLAADLKTDPYKSAIFFDKEIEFIALYGLRKGAISAFDASNIHLFKSACDAYGEKNVGVHFLRGEGSRLDEAEVERFCLAASPIFTFRDAQDYDRGVPMPDPLQYNKWLQAPLQELMLPRHQFVFFSAPEDEVIPNDDYFSKKTIRERLSQLHSPFLQTKVEGKPRRFILPPEFFKEYCRKLLPKSSSQTNPVVEISSRNEFEKFGKRDTCVPFSLSPPPSITDTVSTGSSKNAALNFYAHETHHGWIDMTNPSLPAWEELRDLVPKNKYRESGEGMYEHYLDREISVYRHLLAVQGPQAPLETGFWEAFIVQLFEYENEQNPPLGHLKSVYSPIIDHIHKNRVRWEKEYGITLDGLLSHKGYAVTTNTYKALSLLVAEARAQGTQ